VSAVVAFGACSSSSSDDSHPPDAGVDQSTPPPPPNPPGDDGGDSGVPANLLPRGGSRIAARYYEFSDGSRFFADLYDKKLSVPCGPQLADDGMFRCIPSNDTVPSQLYSDPGCTTRLAQVTHSTCNTAPPYAVEHTAGSNKCALIRTVYAVTSQTPATTFFQKDPGGACIAAVPTPDNDFLPMGAKVAASEFVAFTPANDSVGGGVSAHVQVGEDGSRVTYADQLFDDKRAQACAAAFGTDSKARCIPSGMRAYEFSDPGCTQLVAVDDDCKPTAVLIDTTTAVAAKDISQCAAANTLSVFPVGAKRASHDVFFGTPAMCTGPNTLASDDFYDLGAELPPTTFPELVFGKMGGTRITADTFSIGGVPLSRGPLHDGETTCFVTLATDGVLRCLPNTSPTGLFFSDDKCTTPLIANDDACETTKYARTTVGNGCSAQTRINAVGARMDTASTTFWSTLTGTCAPFLGNTGKYLWPLAAEVAPTTFVDAKLALH
jgi:hypothetical protein